MSWNTPKITVLCDNVKRKRRCRGTETLDLTECAQQSWDARNVEPELIELGWRITEGETICPDCCESEKNADE